MKKLLFLVVVAVLAYVFIQERGIFIPGSSSRTLSAADSILQNAYNNKQNHFQVQGEGVVKTILPDPHDMTGTQTRPRSQHFILELSTGQRLFVSHNIEVAPRISGLRIGDTVEFNGEYKWNSKGGEIHRTHHSTVHNPVDGWLKHDGKMYR